jgi:hypothetical protein
LSLELIRACRTEFGQKPPVEVDIQFDQPRTRFRSLNGRFAASKLPRA